MKHSFPKRLTALALALLMALSVVVAVPLFVIGASAAEPGSTVKYTFSSYTAGTQYAENEVHVLDETVTITTTQAHFTSELRLYSSSSHDGYAIIQSALPMASIVINAGNKADTLNVYTSDDGTTWTLAEGVATASSYKDYTVAFSTATKYIKLDVAGTQQVRIKYMTITFAESTTDPDTPTCQHTNTEAMPAVPATCASTGLTEGLKCADCGFVVTAQETVPMLDHTLEGGVCTACGAVTSDAPASAIVDAVYNLAAGATLAGGPYTLTGVITSADALNETYNSRKVVIVVNGASAEKPITCYGLKGDGIEALAVGDVITVTGELMNYSGTYEFTTGCTFVKDESSNPDVPACEHTNTEAIGEDKDATCTETGITAGEKCSDCGEVITAQETIPALGHSYTNGACSVCGEAEPDLPKYEKIDLADIKANQNIIIVATKEATSWAMSNDKGSGSAPGAVVVTIENGVIMTDAADILWNISNDNGNLTIYPAGTTETWLYCTSSNNGVRVGTNANKVFTIDSATGYLKNAATGRYLGVYNAQDWRCYTNTTGNTADQTFDFYVYICPHATTEVIGEDKAPTCTESGSTAGLKCTDCGEILTPATTIDPLGHNFVGGVCTNEGCGEIACDHIDKGITLGDVTKPATCTETGLQEQFCAQCNQPLADKVLDMVAHTTVIDEAVAPTCTEIGWTEGSHCSVCMEILVEQEVVEMIDHDYVDNKCTVCGDIKVTGSQLADFEFGANGEAKHNDGSEIKSDFSYINGDYTLALTSPAKVYNGAYDARGNSVLKLGTSSAAASFSFTVPNNVNTVVFYIAGYKANTAKVSVNGTEYTITSKSDEGAYTKIVVDTTTDKTVTLETLSGGYRAMINSIEFWGEPAPAAPSILGVSLNLNKGVTVNVKYDIPAEWLAANPDSYVEFSNGKYFDAKAGVNTYSVTLMATSITGGLTVCLNGNYSNEVEVGVYAYADKIAEHTPESLNMSQEKYDALVELLNKIKNYGNATALTTPVDSYEFEGVEEPVVDDPDAAIGAVSAVLNEAANIEINLNTENIPAGSTVSLSVGDRQLLTDAAPEGFYRVKNLYPAHFDDKITITVKHGETQVASLTFTFNAYLKALFDAETTENYRKNLIIATFEYGVAAEAFKAAQ